MRISVRSLPALADHLVAGGIRDEMGEALHRDACRRRGWSSSTASARDRKRGIGRVPYRTLGWLFTGRRSAGSNSHYRRTSRNRRMFTNRRTVRIEWGDCDPAGIVFYPRYFAMFDHSTVLLIERALGMSKHAALRSLRLRRLSGGRDAGALPDSDALRRRRGDRDQRSPRCAARASASSTGCMQGRRAGGRRLRDPGLGGARSRRGPAASRRSRCRTTWSARFRRSYCAALMPSSLAIARALRCCLDRGGEFGRRAGADDLAGGGEARRRSSGRPATALHVGGDAVAQRRRHVARSEQAGQAVERQCRESRPARPSARPASSGARSLLVTAISFARPAWTCGCTIASAPT